jgi:hypothetical protein
VFGLGYALEIVCEREELGECVGLLRIGLYEFVDGDIVVRMMFTEYFIEIVLGECMPSMQLKSIFMFVLLFVHLLPNLMKLLQSPMFFCIKNDVYFTFVHQFIQDTSEQPHLTHTSHILSQITLQLILLALNRLNLISLR